MIETSQILGRTARKAISGTSVVLAAVSAHISTSCGIRHHAASSVWEHLGTSLERTILKGEGVSGGSRKGRGSSDKPKDNGMSMVSRSEFICKQLTDLLIYTMPPPPLFLFSSFLVTFVYTTSS